jgi:GH15 family glucan-1,4-alpha-glucosidase
MRENPRRNTYKSISDYGVIGDCHSAALVGLDGSIDWCCFPRFDSPSMFAAILDAGKGGYFSITPQGAYSVTQRYLDETNILETRFETEGGACSLTDCMPLYFRPDGKPVELHQIIRLLRCEVGEVTLQVNYAPRPDYARQPVKLVAEDNKVLCNFGKERLELTSPVPLDVAEEYASGTVTLKQGEEALFVLWYDDETTREVTDGLTTIQRIEKTVEFWRRKVDQVNYSGLWRDMVVRSYLVLHLLMYIPTFRIIAAPTTSLPEKIGGPRNWDYRYAWIRDSSFTIRALLSLGHVEEANLFFHRLAQASTEDSTDLRIMRRVGGERDLEEAYLTHLEGYRGSQPVRIGNHASHQEQLDIYGEVMNSADQLALTEKPFSREHWELLRTLANLAASNWTRPDNGMWEVRGRPQHFVYSKVMCWTALDRALALAAATGHAGPEVENWRETAETIKAEVLRRGWSQRKQAFVQHYGSEAMDAGNLVLPLVGFLPCDDPRVVSTVKRIQQELSDSPFIRRYRPEETDDGLYGTEEGTFTLCSFWLVRVLALIGAVEEARKLFEDLLGYANHLGLFSEMIDPNNGTFLGNFAQGFTHVGIIVAAHDLARTKDG